MILNCTNFIISFKVKIHFIQCANIHELQGIQKLLSVLERPVKVRLEVTLENIKV